MTTDNKTQRKLTEARADGQRLKIIGRWGVRFILLLLFVVSGLLHDHSYRQGLRQQQLLVATEAHLTAHQQQCQQRAQQSARQQQTLRSLFDQQTERLLQSQQITVQQAQQLSQLQQQVLVLSASSRADWQLLEIQSLLKAAGHQLWLLHNVAAARRLLQGAADLLTTVNNPALLPLRQALADDSRRLAGIDLPDQEALVLQLLNSLDQVGCLPIARRRLVMVESTTVPTTPAVERAGWIQYLLQQGQYLLRRLITIQRQTDQGVALAALSESTARERLSAYLRLAVQAVLQQQSVHYQHCLSRMISLLQEQFEPQDPSVLALSAQLQQWRQQQPLQLELPQQLQSQILLEAFLQPWLGDSRLLSPQSGMVQ